MPVASLTPWGQKEVGVEKEVKPLGNPLSQAVGRRRHHGGSWAGLGNAFPRGATGHWTLVKHTPQAGLAPREMSLLPIFKGRSW